MNEQQINVVNFPVRPGVPLDLGGGGPHDPDMNARIDRLDRAVERIDTDLPSIKVSVGKIETKLGAIEMNMATKLWVMTGAVMVLLAIIGGFWWITQQYLIPIIRAVGH